jgi:hypothetical protein
MKNKWYGVQDGYGSWYNWVACRPLAGPLPQLFPTKKYAQELVKAVIASGRGATCKIVTIVVDSGLKGVRR